MATGPRLRTSGTPMSVVWRTVWITGREAGIQQMDRSMQRLRSERIDLMQVHNLVDNMRAGFGRLPDAAMRRRMSEHVGRL